ncbi:beta-glucuronidase-like [Symsagittifera roscoffensis]|uniref:beta-glucuronidase-like n=1 Tax=Symsagittifera roscoffensis TaxID=84072 RepID=UPI00307BBCAF
MKIALLLLLIFFFIRESVALLKVIDSASRQFKTLDGFWDFLPDYSAESVNEKWWLKPLETYGEVIQMPVPSSFNDITTDARLRDHLGWVWYETFFPTPTLWLNSSGGYDSSERQIYVRFESAHYYAMVFINGEYLTEHSVGHLPFEAEIGPHLLTPSNPGTSHRGGGGGGPSEYMNRLTVALNNTLNATTVPPSAYNYKQNTSQYIYPAGYVEVTWQFDFFNYAGLHRPVKLFTVPAVHVDDVTIKTVPQSEDKQTATDTWNLFLTVWCMGDDTSSAKIKVGVLFPRTNSYLYLGGLENGVERKINMTPQSLWWPYTMDTNYGLLHELTVDVELDGVVVDRYTQKFGFRHVSLDNTSLYINGVKTYLTGINKHEDSDIRGKGLDYALIGRDFANQKWLQSNAFRSSHYPYAQEYLEMADSQGIMVIGECPGVGIQSQNMLPETLSTHERSIREMISRDKNHPSIIIWSLANEPSSNAEAAEQYFGQLFNTSRTLDDTRPYTFVSDQSFDTDLALQFSDLVNVNRYIGWYNDLTVGEWMSEEVYHYVKNYHLQFNKPVIMQEYGAGTIPGFHKLPASPFNEEYQVNVLNWTGLAFDRMREEFLVGEFIWNYADFMTEPDVTRVDGNKKGIFTRQRQPKEGAFFLRERYTGIVDKMNRQREKQNNNKQECRRRNKRKN